jgi:uncharacterized membrane protein
MLDKNIRPKIYLPRTPLDHILEITAALGIIFAFYLIWRCWVVLPQRIPTHFNFTGQPDSWGSKGTLLILPMISLALFTVFAIIGRFPRAYNYPFAITPANAARQYGLARSLLGWMNFEIVWFFAFLEWKIIRITLGQASGLGPIVAFGLVFVTMGSLGIYIYLARKAR